VSTPPDAADVSRRASQSVTHPQWGKPRDDTYWINRFVDHRRIRFESHWTITGGYRRIQGTIRLFVGNVGCSLVTYNVYSITYIVTEIII
jgi:hypothetical protein